MKTKNNYQYNEKKIKENMIKMKKTVSQMLHQADQLELEKLTEDNVSPIFIRNLNYVSTVTNHVGKNFDYMIKLDTDKVENRSEIKKKFLASGIMLKHVNDLIERYSYDTADFEVHNLLTNDNFMPKTFRKLSDKNKKFVREEFIEMDKNKKIIEGFNLSAITGFFKKIAGVFDKIIGGITKIGKFLGGFLLKFIQLAMKLLMFIFELITKIIPKLIFNIFNIIKKIMFKAIRVGLFTLLIFIGSMMLLLKYWQIFLEVKQPPTPVIFFPALLISLHLFWNETDFLFAQQMSIINGILWLFIGPFKNIVILILGLPKNDPFFTKKDADVYTKIKYFIKMILKNLTFIFIRFFMFTLVLKYFIMFLIKKVSLWIPTFKELILFPIIMFQYFLIILKKFYKYLLI